MTITILFKFCSCDQEHDIFESTFAHVLVEVYKSGLFLS